MPNERVENLLLAGIERLETKQDSTLDKLGDIEVKMENHEGRIAHLEGKNGNGKSIIQIALDKGSWAAIGGAIATALLGKGAH